MAPHVIIVLLFTIVWRLKEMDFITLFAGMGGATGTGNAAATKGGGSSMIIFLALMLGFFYLTILRPQKKRQKEEQALRDNIQIGDEVTTIGGIIGKVVTVKDDAIVIETGADRNKLKIERQAVRTNNTANEKLEAERQAAREAQEAEKQARMEESREKSASSRKKSKKKRSDDEGLSD